MTDLKRGHAPRLHEVARETLLLQIRSGKLLPGDQLLPERELAAQLEVSRPALRQALFSLAGMGMVTITPRGTFVSLSDLGEPLRLLVATIVRQRNALSDFLEYRKVFQVGGARMAAQRAKPEDIALIDQSIRQMEELISAGENPAPGDRKFHEAVGLASHNVFITQMMILVTDMTRDEAYGPILETVYKPPGELQAWVERSRNILNGIRAHDAEAAGAAMAAYLNRVESLVREHLESESQTLSPS